MMRKRIYEIIEIARKDDKLSAVYDGVMIVAIVVSLVPLAFKGTNTAFTVIDYLAAVIFIADYIARLATADLKLKRGKVSFLIYPFTPMAIIDLLAILPSFSILAAGFRVLKLFRLLRALRVLRVFKMIRYSKSIGIIINVMQRQKEPLVAVCVLAAAYTLICALVIFNVEPDTFDNFFEAIYWATVSLTTMGYGDIYPVSAVGRFVTMISSFIGIAIVALPSGIITAGYMAELSKNGEEKVEALSPKISSAGCVQEQEKTDTANV